MTDMRRQSLLAELAARAEREDEGSRAERADRHGLGGIEPWAPSVNPSHRPAS